MQDALYAHQGSKFIISPDGDYWFSIKFVNITQNTQTMQYDINHIWTDVQEQH